MSDSPTWRMIQKEDGSYWVQYDDGDVEYPVHFTEISGHGSSRVARVGRLTEWILPERSVHATFEVCPQCEGEMRPEGAHFRCRRCSWRDSCCD